LARLRSEGVLKGSHVGIVLCFAVAAEVIQIAARIGGQCPRFVELVCREKRVVFSDGWQTAQLPFFGAG